MKGMFVFVQKLWNYCNVLRDDGMSYGDYVEQLTYLLFLKMADERSQPPYNQPSIVPAGGWPCCWPKTATSCLTTTATRWKAGPREGHAGPDLRQGAEQVPGPGQAAPLIVDLIDAENWTILGADVKGDAYEGLLEKNAQDTKSGAGQYFTPRAADPGHGGLHAPRSRARRICDPACGTGGFLFTRTTTSPSTTRT
jgi:type I restriction enzyme M protein